MAKVDRKIKHKEASKMAGEIINEIDCFVDTLQVAGSIRRGAEEIGDIDIVVIPKTGFRERVEKLIEVTSSGKRKIYGNYKGRPINFFITDEKSWGACLMTATGPARYNIRKRFLVKRKGLLLNEYGLFDRKTKEFLAGNTEGDIYKYLGWTHRSPCERE
jgi:DNA polymerase (family 10)